MLCALDVGHADLGQSDVSNLAVLLGALQKTELFVIGHVGIDAVELVEIDAIEAQPAKAAVKFLTQTMGRQSMSHRSGAGRL